MKRILKPVRDSHPTPKNMLKSSPFLRLQNETLFGKWLNAITSYDEGGILIRRLHEDTETHTEQACDNGSRDWSYVAASKGTPKTPRKPSETGTRQRRITR